MMVKIRRIMYVLVILLPGFIAVGPIAQPAYADTEAGASGAAVDRLLTGSTHDWNGALFDSQPGANDCPQDNEGGNCWWWAANSWNALITYAEEHPDDTARHQNIRDNLFNTYNKICNSQCPITPDQRGKDPFTVNTNGNTFFDDIGWWTQTWLNAYEFIGNQDYLYLAEELWNYVTYNGYKTYLTCQKYANDPTSDSGSNIGIVQAHFSGGSVNGPDIFASATYLRNSAWLYSITGDSKYMQGVTYAVNGLNYGGALNTAAWIRTHLLFLYRGTLGSGATFTMADHVDPSTSDPSTCVPMGAQWELHGQGEMVNAWDDLYVACLAYSGWSDKAGFYKNLADELARSIIGDAPGQDSEFYGNGTPPDQMAPTVDTAGILADPCTPGWPDSCTYTNPNPPWLISKGIFELGIYCETDAVNDTVLSQFISQQATAVAGLSHFGPLWDAGTATNSPVISATQTSVLEALDADPAGQGEAATYLMC